MGCERRRNFLALLDFSFFISLCIPPAILLNYLYHRWVLNDTQYQPLQSVLCPMAIQPNLTSFENFTPSQQEVQERQNAVIEGLAQLVLDLNNDLDYSSYAIWNKIDVCHSNEMNCRGECGTFAASLAARLQEDSTLKNSGITSYFLLIIPNNDQDGHLMNVFYDQQSDSWFLVEPQMKSSVEINGPYSSIEKLINDSYILNIYKTYYENNSITISYKLAKINSLNNLDTLNINNLLFRIKQCPVVGNPN